LVLVTGKPICIPWANDHIPAIVAQWYGGEKAGESIAAMLFGQINPCGKTPISWARNTGNLPCYYNHLPTDRGFYRQPGSPNNPGRDYVFSTPEPLWSFGHGLSYTTFEYGTPRLSAIKVNGGDTLTVTVPITNTGVMDGKEVVQLYIHKEASQLVTPVKQLKGFCKLAIPAGQTRDATIQLPIKNLAVTGLEMEQTIENGNYEILIGTSSTDIRTRSVITVGDVHTIEEKGAIELVKVTPDGDTIR
jgi:beta-glucosidase